MNRRDFFRTGSKMLLGATVFGRPGIAAAADLRDRLVFEPASTDERLVNPGIGFETFHCFEGDERDRREENYPRCSIAYFRFYWDKLEPNEGHYDFDLVDAVLAKAKAAGQDLALRFMPTASANLNAGTPRWFMEKGKGFDYVKEGRKGWAPDHNDPDFLARQEALVTAFGDRYNGHPHLIRMEIGSAGFWGEWHLSNTRPTLPFLTEENAVRIIDTYLKHWNRTPLCMLIGYVPGLRYAVSKGTGWRADSLGDYGHWSDTWCHMFNAYPQKLQEGQAGDAWKKGPVAFEPPGSMRDLERYVPSKGGGYDNMWNQALAWHGSAYNAKSGSIPDSQVAAMNRFLGRCGYRFALRRLAVPRAPIAGRKDLTLSAEVENSGVAPPYKDYVLAWKFAGGVEPMVVHSPARPRQWLPGRHDIEERLVLPAPLSAGTWELSAAILDANTRQPAIRLANAGTDREGWLVVGKLEVRT